MYRSRRKKSTDWDDFRSYAREARERADREGRMPTAERAIVTGGAFIILAVVLLILYSCWTANVEAHERIRRNLNVFMLDSLQSGRAELSTETLSQFHGGEIVPLASLVKSGKRDTPLHVLVTKDKLLVFDKKPEDGAGLLEAIEAARKPEDLTLLHYDPTNGTDSAGHDFLIMTRK